MHAPLVSASLPRCCPAMILYITSLLGQMCLIIGRVHDHQNPWEGQAEGASRSHVVSNWSLPRRQ